MEILEEIGVLVAIVTMIVTIFIAWMMWTQLPRVNRSLDDVRLHLIELKGDISSKSGMAGDLKVKGSNGKEK